MKVFIDIDGTLINSFKRHYLLLQKLLDDKKINKKIIIEEYVNCKINGMNNIKYMNDYLNISYEEAKDIQNKWVKEIENEFWIQNDVLYDDTIDFLNFLKEKKYEIMFLTARANQKNLIEELKKLSIYDYAQEVYVVSPIDAINNKKNILITNKNDNDGIIVIGDTEVDYTAAEEIGIRSYILNRGFRSKDYLNKMLVKENYDNLNQIKELL